MVDPAPLVGMLFVIAAFAIAVVIVSYIVALAGDASALRALGL